ncbi:MAG: DUF255 domain-containing protein [Verrucomicrobia bacterium]|nr:DUF255 domain-containing protein [Verrucomicrobiota bacterium]
MKLIRLFFLLSSLALAVPSLHAQARTKVRLLLSAASAKPGETVMAGIEMKMPPRWHTYWRNSGESGLPISVEWQLPTGISAGEIQWPVPEKHVAAGLTTYVYHDETVLLIPLKLASDLVSTAHEIKAQVSWLECDELCLPGSADVQNSLTGSNESIPSPDAALLEEWKKKLPVSDPSLVTRAFWEKAPSDDTRALIVQWEAKAKPETADFYPYGGDTYEVAGPTERMNEAGNVVSLRKMVKKTGDRWPSSITGIGVAKANASASPEAYEVSLTIAESGPGSSTSAPKTSAIATDGSKDERSLLAMLGLAFLGGLILNIMPCVLPVIALKILGFVNQSHEKPQRVRQLGLLYTSGVLASFLVLALLVVAVQLAGRSANWGMQFQNPQFLVGMTLLVTLVALNLFGLFEINLAGRAMGAAGTLASKEGNVGAFFNGVLATALATPCTAPFLGVALGFAFAQSAPIIVLMFLAIGLGLAAPYLVLSWQPSWLKFLPKPGVWMEKLKVAMGFPMLATAVWLFWLTTLHFGTSGTLWLGLFLVTVGLAAWMWGEFVQRSSKRRGWAIAASLVLVVAAYLLVLEKQLSWRSPVVLAKAGGSLQKHPDGIDWKPWSSKAVEEARAAGRPVLVDFTADWCLSCQVNKKTSLEVPSVQAKLKEINAEALIGDHTRIDPLITEELKRHKRAGVPLVLVYPADPAANPIVLPELLTESIVLDALNNVSGSNPTKPETTRAQ